MALAHELLGFIGGQGGAMRARTSLVALMIGGSVILASRTAVAAEPRVEIGAALVSAAIGTGDNDVTMFGLPSSGIGFINPEVYVSFFVGPYVAIEPQVGLQWVSSGGHSEHIANVTGQIDYFVLGSGRPSLYVFASGGIIDSSGSSVNPKTVSAGAGYRIPVGDSLAVRLEGHLTHLTDKGGNAVFLAVSFGGVFGSR